MKIKTVAIIGAGVMGSATALHLARHGYRIILKDVRGKQLEKSQEMIKSQYRSTCMMLKSYQEVKLIDILNRISFQLDYSGFDSVELVIENIDEKKSSKVAEYRKLSSVCNNKTYFAINTSCFSITYLAGLLPNPDKAIGLHFMNPVPMKKTVEVIRGVHTSMDAEKFMSNFLRTIDKKAIIINDMPGFVSNRLSHLLMNEAAFLVQNNVAKPAQVDSIMKLSFGHQMGPLETADLIGLDTVVNSLNVLYESYQDTKFRCCPLLKKMVAAGFYGCKTKKGFYEY